MKKASAIKILEEMELEASLFAQKCSQARKLLERVEGPRPAKKGALIQESAVLDIMNSRKKALLRHKKPMR